MCGCVCVVCGVKAWLFAAATSQKFTEGVLRLVGHLDSHLELFHNGEPLNNLVDSTLP